MNQQILFKMRDMDNPKLFTQEERSLNIRHAYETYLAADTDTREFFTAADATYAVEDKVTSELHTTEDWLVSYFKSSGEDRQLYIDEVKRLKEPWHTLPGETPEKDKRMEMSQDNFYRVIAMHDELIHQQKDEIAKLKQTINKLRMR